jgi:hypothetical protein
MKKSRLRSLSMGISLVALGCFLGSPLFAGDGSSTFFLTGTPNPVLAGVYTSPYTGGLSVASAGPVICDDFGDNSFIPESWQVFETTLGQIDTESSTSSVLKWKGANSNGSVDAPISGGWNLDQKDAYNAAALLAIEILDSSDTVLQREQLSFALWELFDANLGDAALNQNWGNAAHAGDNVVGWLNANDGANAQTDLDAATHDVLSAIQTVTNSNFAGFSGAVTFYSYDAGGLPVPQCSGSPCSDIPPQEFISVTGGTHTLKVAEASIFDTFGLYFLAGGVGLVFLSRRKIFRPQA